MLMYICLEHEGISKIYGVAFEKLCCLTEQKSISDGQSQIFMTSFTFNLKPSK